MTGFKICPHVSLHSFQDGVKCASQFIDVMHLSFNHCGIVQAPGEQDFVESTNDHHIRCNIYGSGNEHEMNIWDIGISIFIGVWINDLDN